MYVEHPKAITPPDDTVIWRYMTFAQFVNILETKTLWFSRIKNFEDPWEGARTIPFLRALKERLPTLVGKEPKELLREIANRLNTANDSNAAEIVRELKAMNWETTSAEDLYNHFCFVGFHESNAINCWHASQHESLAMWNYYCKGPGSVAIKSSVEKIKKAFTFTQHPVIIGKVQYFDNYSDETVCENTLPYILRKPLSYSFESEVRLITTPVLAAINGTSEMINNDGAAVFANIKELVDEIYTHPKCQEWEYDLLNKLLTRVGLESITVMKSFLSTKPQDYVLEPKSKLGS